MFPLHQSSELCFKSSPNPHKKQTISEDLILGQASLEDKNIAFDTTTHDYDDIKEIIFKLPTDLNNNNNCQIRSSNIETKNKKKMKHRDIERLRRQEMATLHASLRSLLPLQLIKGKRSISDHINEAVRYIKHLQVKIKDLGAKRDGLKKSSDLSTRPTDRDGSVSSSSCSPVPGRFLTVQSCRGGVEIIIGVGDFGEGKCFPLSRILEVLLEEGLSLVSCVSTKVNDRFLHTIQSEASNIESINLSALEQKVNEVIDPYSS
ncbi:transcription factor bHLH120 isoform X2 [Morus notabilis]|uniref:transcription factor bHLH120 isoform X2 n=1 Tax=Morus notabilis TaxID=981085 RepID=UPI000CED68E8|nr:transcription factor bHLH120 isoform X2 [Morus notabilis]